MHGHHEKKEKETNEVALKVNVKMNTHWLGFAVGHDLDKVSDMRLLIQEKFCKHFTVFNKVDFMKQVFALGHTYKLKKNKHHIDFTQQLSYDWGNNFSALFGAPLMWTWGGCMHMGKGNKLHFACEVGKNTQLHTKYMHKLDKNWHAGVRSSFYSDRIGTKRGFSDIGVNLKYVL